MNDKREKAEYDRKRRKANLEKFKLERAMYYEKNKELISNKAAERYAKNKEVMLEKAKKWRVNNPEKAKKAAIEWKKNNPEKVKRSLLKWQKANPEIVLMHERNRRARKKKSTGSLSAGLRTRLFKLQKGKCACCGEPLGNDCHMDHIMPLALGGENIDSNIQLLRSLCNKQKNAKHPIDFMQSRGFLL